LESEYRYKSTISASIIVCTRSVFLVISAEMARFTVRRGGEAQQNGTDICSPAFDACSRLTKPAQLHEAEELSAEKVQSPETKDLSLVDGRPLEARSSTEANSADESQYDFDSAEFKNIPELVRTVVGFEDDPSLPVLTFRSILLSATFCTLGSIVSQLS
jgi:hypothetical protein